MLFSGSQNIISFLNISIKMIRNVERRPREIPKLTYLPDFKTYVINDTDQK